VRVLVTGAFGYVGLTLVRRLAAEHAVVALGRAPRACPPGVEVVAADILALPRLAPLDAVVHLAALGPDAEPRAMVRTNVLGSQLVLDAARAAGVTRCLFASTVAVYAPAAHPARETDPTGAADLHAATKEAAERSWTAQGGVALRLAPIYGAGSGIDLGRDGPFDRLARAAAAGGDLPVASGGSKLDAIEISDAVEAFARALVAPRPPPVLNIGSGVPVRMGEFAAACVTAANKLGLSPRIVPAPARTDMSVLEATGTDVSVLAESTSAERGPRTDMSVLRTGIRTDVSVRTIAVGLAVATLGWQPRRKPQDGVDELVAMYRNAR
jgi:UDP-glucose 4-epimerase